MFNIYDISSLDVNKFMVWTENNVDGATKFHNEQPENIEPVLCGLSQGEVSQALIDYAKQDFKRGEQLRAVSTLADIVQFSSLENFTEDQKQDMDISQFEDVVYKLPAERLCGLWVFSNKTLFIKSD